MNHPLYQHMILDHSKSPKGFCQDPKGQCEDAHNPLCGDKVKLCLTVQGGKIQDICFWGEGCSLSMASASLLVDVCKGMTVPEFKTVQAEFLKQLRGESSDLPIKLQIFSGVLNYPMRVKCVTMAWHAGLEALEKSVDISGSCIEYWSKLVSSQGGRGIQLGFKQLGCYGWQFVPKVESEGIENSVTLEYGNMFVWIEPEAFKKIQGTKIDYVSDELGQSQVIFQHPKAKQHCGCGESFVLEDEA